jgi:ABC-type transport system involved in Fe-S cluster assembly, ATPase component
MRVIGQKCVLWKSTLSNVITGRQGYYISKGDVRYKNESIIEWPPEQRALAGLFMSFQYPLVMPRVNNTYFLKSPLNAKLKHKW